MEPVVKENFYSVLDIILLSADYLKVRGVPSPRREADNLVSQALNMERFDLYLNFDRPLTKEELIQCRELLKRRGEREPFDYICEKVSFFDCALAVTPSVLIPRPETEILVSLIVENLCLEQLKGKVLFDLCTGSGCIGIALKKRFAELTVFSSDISEEAVAIAEDNARHNCVEMTFLQGDLLTPFEGRKASFVVCNPPYVSEEEYRSLEPEVVQYEPKLALVAEENGLAFYRRLAEQLPLHLEPNAKVWLEIGATQGSAVEKIFRDLKWKTCEVMRDFSGKPRFVYTQIG